MTSIVAEAAPGDENDDNWLYGDSNAEETDKTNGDEAEAPKDSTHDPSNITGDNDEKEEEADPTNDDSHFNDEHFAEVGQDDNSQANGDVDSQDNADSDSDDSDDIKVTIGEIKTGPQAYASLNIKRGVGLVAAGSEKPRSGAVPGGKVTLEDIDGLGSINGVPALEFNIDTIEDKPWNKPGADISDYFNYGFNEVTWVAYCERQKRLRVNEAGVGLHATMGQRMPAPDNHRPGGRNENNVPAPVNNYQLRENTIQVMTAERREYTRGVGGAPPTLAPPPVDYFAPPPAPAPAAHYYPPQQPYDQHWGPTEGSAGWAPGDIKELTPGPPAHMGPPPLGSPHAPPHLPPHYAPPPSYRPPSHMLDRDRERTRERDDRDRRDRRIMDDDDRDRRDRSRSIKPDRLREKSYRRERSRSRSRRHRSRSRSPRPRDRDRSRDRERSRERDRSRERERALKSKRKESPPPKDEDKS